jgi:hypothetical protein
MLAGGSGCRELKDDPAPARRRGDGDTGFLGPVAAELNGGSRSNASDSNAFTKLARYESNIERALFRALQELQRLQSARLDADPAPPPTPSRST